MPNNFGVIGPLGWGVADLQETRPSSHVLPCQIWPLLVNRMACQIFENAGVTPPLDRAWLANICYPAEVVCFRPNGLIVITEILTKIWSIASRLSRSLKIISIGCLCLLSFHSNHRPILYRFRDIARRRWSKIANFLHPAPSYRPHRVFSGWPQETETASVAEWLSYLLGQKKDRVRILVRPWHLSIE